MRYILGGFETDDISLGQGAYGQVLRGVDPVTSEEVALKLERASSRTTRSPLEHEAQVYTALAGGLGVPAVIKYGRDGKHNVLVLDLLGPSLEALLHSHGPCLSMKTVLMLAEQIITRVEFVHSRHIIHRDLKPDNLLMGIGSRSDSVYLIDFGLARPYRDPLTHVHHPFAQGKDLVGTTRYASLNTHFGYAQSRRDDLESVAYSLIYLAKGQLPWQGIKAGSPKQKEERVREKKKTWTPERLTEGLPPEFATFLVYVRGLAFDERPDYQYARTLFQTAFRRGRYQYDSIFDWSTGPASPPGEEQAPKIFLAKPSDATPPALSLPEDVPCASPLLGEASSPLSPVTDAPSAPESYTPKLAGAYVFIKLLPRPSLQNDDHVFRGWTDHSFWQSPSLSRTDWHFPWRPSMILSAISKGGLTTLVILPIMRRPDGLQTLAHHRRHRFLPVHAFSGEHDAHYSIHPTPVWPLRQTYHYNTHRLLSVAVQSDVANSVPVHWKLDEAELAKLRQELDRVRPPAEENEPVDAQDGEATVSVKRHRNKGTAFNPLFADIAGMDAGNPERKDGAEWGSSNGWLREKHKMLRRRAFEWGYDGDTSTDSDVSYDIYYSAPPPGSRCDSCTLELHDVDRTVEVAGRVLRLDSLHLPVAEWKALALSHPVFRHRAQERLFRNVQLFSDGRTDYLLDAFTTRPELACLVKSLSMTSPIRDAGKAVLTAVSPNLGALSLKLAAGEDAGDYLGYLMHAPALHTLSIVGSDERACRLTWAGRFSKLQHVFLTRVSIHVTDGGGAFPYALSSLKLERVYFISGNVEGIRGRHGEGAYSEQLVDVISKADV